MFLGSRQGDLLTKDCAGVVYLGIRDWIKPCGRAGAFFILSQNSVELLYSQCFGPKTSFGTFCPVQEARGLNELKEPRQDGGGGG